MSSLVDAISQAIQNALEELVTPIRGVIQDNADDLLAAVVGTPMPDVVFGRPSATVWPSLYDYYWHDIVPLALALWALSVGLVIFAESTSHLFSGYHQSRLKRRAFTGLIGILAWWWVAALSLRFTNALTGVLLPDLSQVTLFQTLSVGVAGALLVAVSLTVDLVVFLLVAFVYVARQVVLYLFVLLTPLLIALWVPGIGPFAYVSGFVKRLGGFYVPFLLMPVPVAMLLRLASVLGENFALTTSGVFSWVIALLIPVVALLSPFVLVWQAGSLLQTSERFARRSSVARGRARVGRAHGYGNEGVQGGRNFARGVRGRPALRSDGQELRTGSRAHAVGSRLGSSGSRLRDRVRATVRPEAAAAGATSTSRSRDADVESLRTDRRSSTSRRTRSRSRDDDEDEPPRYIH